MDQSYYEVLSVAESASRDEVRKAYRRLILRYHPDRNSDPRAGVKAALLNEAYSNLSDPHKRDRKSVV